MELVWTTDRDIDTVHRAGCQHTRMAHDVRPLDATSTDGAQREIASSMGWDNWPAEHDAEFDINVAACAR